ncbi:DEAD/DEAH box helicase [Paenibacillus sp. TRM 82003]|nr:DEAD/DEAH box helicase [Paenibacillus sp. TRM 82003]
MAHEALGRFHPVLQDWFEATFGAPTDVQVRAWAAVESGSHALIAAPTGSGKTLAALLPGLDAIARAKSGGAAYAPGVRLLYVTPLKALNNDIHHHVVGFAAALDALAAARGAEDWRPITAAVRTGDTPQSTRASMLKRPPDVLVTTPESLYLLLLSERSREILRTVTHVVVDEIHDLVPSKRGAHLSVSLERLTQLSARAGREPQRIGVSATQKPLETAAAFLAGCGEDGAARPYAIVESAMDKTYDIQVTVPDFAVATQDREAVWKALLDRLTQLMGDAKTALIFVNNRRLSERLVLRMNERFGDGFARPHHGSVSRERRLEAERLLKAGELRCLAATSSLELGIDVGHIELVLQIDSPLSAASGIQRIGRAGHGVGDVSVGRIVVRSRGALLETAVLAKLIRERDIEPIRMTEAPADVLSQQLVAIVASASAEEPPLEAPALLRLVRGAAPFRALAEERFYAALNVLAGFFPFAKPLLDWNRETGLLSARRNTRMAAVTGTGTIPSSTNYPIVHADTGLQLGDLEEEFVHESSVGDVFQLGAGSWMIRAIKHDRVLVGEAANRFSEVPFWRGDAGGRGFALGERIGAFAAELLTRVERASEPELAAWLAGVSGFDGRAAAELADLVRRQQAVSRLPTDRRIVVERYEDMSGQTHVLVHNYWGRRVNRAWLMALQHIWSETLPHPPYANAKDNGIELVFRSWEADALPRLWRLTPETAAAALAAALPSSALFAGVFRRLAETSLLLTRGFARVPSWQRRIRAEELLQASLPFAAEFPLFAAALEECMAEHLDAASLTAALERLQRGEYEIVTVDTDAPSPLAAQFTLDYVAQMLYEGDAPSDDLRRQLQSVSRELAGQWFAGGEEDARGGAASAVQPDVLEAERRRLETAGRAVASPDDLAALLKQRGDLPLASLRRIAGADDADAWLAALIRSGRAAAVTLAGEERFIAGDERETYARFPAEPAAATFVLQRFIDGVVAFTAEELAARFGLAAAETAARIEAWAADGRIEPAPFADPAADGDTGAAYWSSRKVASRLVRLSLSAVRSAAAPAEPERWCRLLLARHGFVAAAAADATAAVGPHAAPAATSPLRSALEPLQGLFLPASQWEAAILPARLPGYRREELDLLCASGELTWLGRRAPGEKEGRIAFFLAGNEPLQDGAIAFASPPPEETPSAHPELFELLRRRGASFLTRLSADTGEPPSALLPKLVDLVWEGRVANDQFAPIRNFLLAKGALHPKLGSGHGRWYAIDPPASDEPLAQERAVAWLKHLLRTFGAVTSGIVNAYAPFGWDAALPLLKQLEEWGWATRGLFIEDVPTLQFMERETIPALRGWERSDAPADRRLALVSATDPATPYGIALPWPDVPNADFARKPSHALAFVDGVFTYWIEAHGKRITRIAEPPPGVDEAELLLPVFRRLLRQNGLKRIRIETWDGRTAADTTEAAALITRGAERDRGALVLWPSTLS